MGKIIYLDHAAATPVDPRVMAVMQPYFSEDFYNPSAIYLAAKKVKKDIEASRAKVAAWMGARPSEITFTAGGTEANNLAIKGVMSQFLAANIVISEIEHESVLKPAQQHKYKVVGVKQDGLIDLDKLEASIDSKTVLVSVMLANNEIGTIQPIRKIGQLLEKLRQERLTKGNKTPLYFHTDACQAANYIDLHANRLGVDLMTINGGKIYGPKQSGALFIRTGTNLKPQILGGGQESGVRSGTENVAGIIGLSKALDLVQKNHHVETVRLQKLQQLFFELINKQMPPAQIVGSVKNRLPNNVHITIAGQDNERLIMELDERGVLCAAGSACSASNEDPSHVLKAIGLSDEEAQSSLRFTMGQSTTESDVKQTVKTLAGLVNG